MDNTRKRTARQRFAILAASAVAVVAIIAATAYSSLYGRITDRDSTIYIYHKTGIAAFTDSLAADGTLTKPRRFLTVARAMGVDSVRAGRYMLRAGTGARQAAAMFRIGAQTPLRVTFNNIRTMPQFAAVLGKQLMADSAAFAAILTDDSVAQANGFRPEEFIGMFIPDTYEFYWTVAPEAFVERMHREYDRFWEPRRQLLQHTGLNERQVASLAAIIDEETARTDEMPTIAGVYINRLRRGMRLQADPTVKFAMGDFTLRRILRRHLATKSPYNTYLHAGLPPGPIRMPSKAAIDAVLHYEKHDYLYFCARADFSGYHSFARTLAEHNRNARAYSAALDRLGIK